jgi:hypothetical protein
VGDQSGRARRRAVRRGRGRAEPSAFTASYTRRGTAGAVAAAALVLGPASPAAAEADPAAEQAPAVRSDGGDRAALWVVSEVVVLIGGAGAARAWSSHRKGRLREQPRLDGRRAGNGTPPAVGDGRPPPTRIRL